MNLQQFLSNGGFAKMAATIIQTIFVLGAGVLLFLEVYNNQTVNPYILGLLGVILGHQVTVNAGVQSGGDLLNALQTPLPLNPMQSANTKAMIANTSAIMANTSQGATTQANTQATEANTVATEANTATQPKVQAVQP